MSNHSAQILDLPSLLCDRGHIASPASEPQAGKWDPRVAV